MTLPVLCLTRAPAGLQQPAPRTSSAVFLWAAPAARHATTTLVLESISLQRVGSCASAQPTEGVVLLLTAVSPYPPSGVCRLSVHSDMSHDDSHSRVLFIVVWRVPSVA